MTAVTQSVAFRQRPLACRSTSDQLLPIHRFKKWAAERRVLFPKLDITCFEGIRGICAKEPLSEGDIVIRLPRTSALVIEPTTKPPAGCPEELWKKQPWFLKLAMKLACEINLEEDSYFSGYIESLPEPVDIPCFWPDEDIARLRYPSLITSITKQRAEWDELVNAVIKDAPDIQLDGKRLQQCLSYVRTRSFSGPYIGSKLPNRIRLGIIVLALATINVAYAGVNAIEPTVNAVLAVSTFNFLYEFFLSQRLKVYLLAPGVDFMNHSCQVSCDLSYDYFFDGYSVRLDRDYDTGEQVFISYGQKSNDELLQYFGFFENNNPYDTVVVEEGIQKMFSIFCSMTSADGSAVGNIGETAVIVHTRGFDDNALKTVKAWVKQAEKETLLILTILIAFCRQEANYLDSEFSSGDSARDQLINNFRKEKASILTKCIEFLKEQKNRYIG